MSYGTKGAAISQGIAQGVNQAGASLLQAGMFKKRLDTDASIWGQRIANDAALQDKKMAHDMALQDKRSETELAVQRSRDAMQRRVLLAKLGWAKGMQGPGGSGMPAGLPTPVRPTSAAAPHDPGFEQSVGNFSLPAFAPSKDFGEMGVPGPRGPMPGGADLLARREEEY